jgi:hypothetical protein
MKTMLLAATAALSLDLSLAYADDGHGPVSNTQFTAIPGVIAQATVHHAPAVAPAQNGRMHTYLTNSGRGTWLLPPNQDQGSGH